MKIPTNKEIDEFWTKVFKPIKPTNNMNEQVYKLKPEYSHISYNTITSIAIDNKVHNHKDTCMTKQGDIFKFSGSAAPNLKNAGVLDLWFDKVEPSKLSIIKKGAGFQIKSIRWCGSIEFTIDEQMFADLRDYFRAL